MDNEFRAEYLTQIEPGGFGLSYNVIGCAGSLFCLSHNPPNTLRHAAHTKQP